MSKSLGVSLVWYRNDLRIIDHKGLSSAIESNRQVVAYYNFNPELFKDSNWGFKKTDRYRTKFLIESVSELQEELNKLNISLIVDNCLNERNLLKTIKKLNVKEIFTQREWTRDEVNEENEIFNNIDRTIKVSYSFDQFLYHPKDLKQKIDNIPDVFTLFRKKCEKDLKVRPLTNHPSKLESKNRLPEEYIIPNLNDLGFKDFEVDNRSSFPFNGGTKNGIERVINYPEEVKTPIAKLLYELDIEIWPQSIILPKGYQIGINVSGQDFDRPGESVGDYMPCRGSGPFLHNDPYDRPKEIFGGNTTIYSGEIYNSYILLPIIPSN